MGTCLLTILRRPVFVAPCNLFLTSISTGPTTATTARGTAYHLQLPVMPLQLQCATTWLCSASFDHFACIVPWTYTSQAHQHTTLATPVFFSGTLACMQCICGTASAQLLLQRQRGQWLLLLVNCKYPSQPASHQISGSCWFRTSSCVRSWTKQIADLERQTTVAGRRCSAGWHCSRSSQMTVSRTTLPAQTWPNRGPIRLPS